MTRTELKQFLVECDGCGLEVRLEATREQLPKGWDTRWRDCYGGSTRQDLCPACLETFDREGRCR